MPLFPKICVKNYDTVGEILTESFPDTFTLDESRPLIFCETPDQAILRVDDTSEALTLCAPDLNHFWTALGDWMSGDLTPDHPMRLTGIPYRGAMLDASRNAVPTIPYLKRYLLKLALNGLNQFCLYTEDTYTVPDEPLFGYGRGRYSDAEIEALDAFAYALGVELFPCIQTLGHFEQFLRYATHADLQDNPRVLNTQKDATYIFVEKLIASATRPYRSNKIHLGLDEPWGLGRGKALNMDHPKAAAECFAEHLTKVVQICEKLNLEPMIWGDYILGHSGENALSENLIAKLPKNVRMVYWDYTHTHRQDYIANIEKYRALGFHVSGAPSAHNFGRIFPDFNEVEKTCAPFADAMIRSKVDTALITLWGDDGHECLNTYTLPALIYALACFRGYSHNPDFWAERFLKFSGITEIQVRQLALLSEPGIHVKTGPDTHVEISGKMLFWDDPFHRYILRMLDNDSIFGETKWRWFRSNASNAQTSHIQLIEKYCLAIGEKTELVTAIARTYRENDRFSARTYASQIPHLMESIRNFYTLYRTLWLRERKPFGLEIIDHRIGGLLQRLEELNRAVTMWADHEIEAIPELAENEVPEGLTRADLAFHNRIFSRCYQLWV